jgi:hypothetical protein
VPTQVTVEQPIHIGVFYRDQVGFECSRGIAIDEHVQSVMEEDTTQFGQVVTEQR